MGVDIDMVKKRQPGVLNRMLSNEQDLKIFLLSKEIAKKGLLASHQDIHETDTHAWKSFKTMGSVEKDHDIRP